MIRKLQVVADKHAPSQYVAGEAMTRGMSVKIDFSTGKVMKNTGATQYFVDVEPNYNGINAVIDPQEKDFEDIKAGNRVVLVPVLPTEAYAVTELTAGSLAKGDKIDAVDGKFQAATAESGTAGQSGYVAASVGDFIYDGEYSDPTGLTMYRIIKA